MKFKVLVLAAGLLGAVPLHAENYVEASGGYETYGVRVGHTYGLLDFSGGYFTAYSDALESDVTNHVIDLEAYRGFELPYGLEAKVGGGVGYAIPSVQDGPETADKGYSWLLGVGLDYYLTKNLSIGGSVKRLFFTTDTHKVVREAHTETLSTGQEVEVSDERREDNSTNFKTFLYAVRVQYSF